MPMRRRLLAALLTALPLFAWAAWPERPITIVVPAAAGGTTDIAARVLAEKMGKDLGTAIVVENKGGGGGSIGTAQVARAKPDGYTLLMGNIGPIAINFSLYKQLSYKESDLRGITNVISVPNILVVHADSPARSVKDLVGLAKARRLNVSTSGVGQSPHMSSEMFRQKAGIEVTLVPFPGAAPAVTALLGQQVDFMIDNLPSSMPHIKSGKFRALAITSGERAAQLPDVPTMAEAGVPMQVTAWFGLLAPSGTPDAVVLRLQQSARKAMHEPDVRQRFAELGGVPGGETPAEYDAFIAQERKSWAQIVKAAGLSLE
ncbi:MFS transporter [Alicycliphilus denitrificans]|uniref:Tripartite tricarboxylate transporter substrate binding protein n=1 Tax=Alicycliphilus denitrificans TaxID=179636 RepID=A0A420KH65_9BURK|nr:tripartite tricarboxylate transporter substrate binding protein [Alicycliphilus denitrificans]MBN9573246.1 tripartite tricarboxylate transporter substrate binding protein [Alicycliphilus denitrificans]OJW90742.1 MAG: ABC transporter substrate-binding protein [Alicycliphilus sp. 69-12]RKJ99275.1 tripartite tricarboxylate transporter substrate binding protein [Alicycliphilus denitrificans]BCN36834.1 MFS transporter [Alicycliphilus denitrificans]